MHWRLSENTQIVLGAEAVRPVERAAIYLQEQVQQRTGWSWEIAKGGEPQPGDIVLGIPGDGVPAAPLTPEYPEEIAIWCGGDPASPNVFALAGGPSVAMAAAGRLARTMDLRPGHTSLPSLSLREHPAFPVRGHLYASHRRNNTCDMWTYEHWEEYLTEMAAWGDNIALVLPLPHFPGILPFEEEPWFDHPEKEREFQRQLEVQLRIPGLCHELGMRYGIWLPVNNVFPEEVARHPELSKGGRSDVCPHVPEARRRIREHRERLFSLLPALDVLFLPSHDGGGCPGCEDCTPWGPVFEELAEEQAAQARKHHPSCKVWLSQQGLSAWETEHLMDWLGRTRPGWLEGVVFGPFSEGMAFRDPLAEESELCLDCYSGSGPISGPVNRLRAALPGQYRLILYPDETHAYRCQYPVVGMDPTVQYVWNREDGPVPRPKEMAALHAATTPPSDGCIPYSEGDTDDVNKIVWSSLCWNSAQSAQYVAAEYARWFFGPRCAQEATQIILKVEDILNAPLYGNPQVKEAVALLQACEMHQPELLDNWRWLNLRLGVLMLDCVQQVMHRDRRLAGRLRYRVAVLRHSLDPAPGLRQTIHYLEREFTATQALLRDIVWTRDRLFALHRLAVRGVARLQNSYMRFDVLLERWKEVLARLEEGEDMTYEERLQAIREPLADAEDSLRLAVAGISLVEHIQEFAWQKGPAI